MLTGHFPFFSPDEEEKTKSLILHGRLVFPAHVSRTACHLVASMLRKDSKKRAKLETVKQNEWFQDSL